MGFGICILFVLFITGGGREVRAGVLSWETFVFEEGENFSTRNQKMLAVRYVLFVSCNDAHGLVLQIAVGPTAADVLSAPFPRPIGTGTVGVVSGNKISTSF